MYSNKLICDILKYIDINLNKKITIDDLNKKFFYNRYYIMKLFKKEIGLTIFEYINSLRIYYSIIEMKNTNHNLSLICFNNGFYSLEYFSEIFKKIAGVNPSTFKNFLEYHSIISDKDLKKCINTIIYLKELINKKENYLKNIKPIKSPIKSLTIFK